MKTRTFIMVSALLLLVSHPLHAQQKDGDAKAEKPKMDEAGGKASQKNAKDDFVGTYIRIPFIGTYGNVNPEATGKKIQIKKSGEAYQLSGYSETFMEKSKGVLQDVVPGNPTAMKGALGTITAGQMNFHNGSKPMDVLKVKFAFDEFLLIKVDDTVPLEP